ncbi:AraC family transcriptional regulator [Rhizobium sp. YK2]|uniref:helix-turn-helix domain-containing protein n=1 Tax=Rhizobium sp. YK2 TaxID=1860096 RepID=UPI00114CCA2F|nr:AraC family transcriptional regulator [Rhizobium sp. YK2]
MNVWLYGRIDNDNRSFPPYGFPVYGRPARYYGYVRALCRANWRALTSMAFCDQNDANTSCQVHPKSKRNMMSSPYNHDRGSGKKMDTFGCQLAQLDRDRQISGGGIDFYHKSSDRPRFAQVATPASDRGYVVGISLADGHRRRIFGAHSSSIHDFQENSVYLRNFADPYKADMSGSFDFALMEISSRGLSDLADGADMKALSELNCKTAEPDVILGGMVRALFSIPDVDKNPLLRDQLSIAIGVHLVHKYGNGRSRFCSKRERLSRAEEDRAKEFLRNHLKGDVSIDALAATCNLSRVAFIGAFRQSTGQTPHEWLLDRRIEQACALLSASRMSLGDISKACGFAGLSQFTRTFTHLIGQPPGTWRRARLS